MSERQPAVLNVFPLTASTPAQVRPAGWLAIAARMLLLTDHHG